MSNSLYNAKDFSATLHNVHNAMLAKMKRNTLKRDAAELQQILQEIKLVARDFNNVSDSVIGQEMRAQYEDLINLAFMFQSPFHNKNMKASTIFRREHGGATVKEADDIFEEDLAAILAAGEFMGTGNQSIQIQHFLFGGSSTGTKATSAYKQKGFIDEEELAEDLIKKLAEKENKKASSQIGRATGKVDINGKNITLKYTKELPFKVERLMTLMKDATVSAKNYKSHSYKTGKDIDLSELGIHLGNSNLYKAITGALSEVQLGWRQQTAFFYRGLNTIINNSDGNGELARTHFSHLRFIYELRGSGLLDDNGFILPVKYIIYNDPSSDAIFVRDTASIIVEALESSMRDNNLLGNISISASRIKS